MLEIVGATVRFGSTPAVDQVDLTVRPGEILALLGPSGCGKSTLLRAVAGVQRLDAGRMSWSGVDLAGVPAYRRGFGLMFQDGALFPHRTVAGNVGYGLTEMTRPARAERVAELLELVGLAGFAGRAVASLSGGQAQRVALARALAPAPRLLLLDEPLAALDRSLRERLLDDLGVILRSAATTAIFVTHDQDEAFALADQVALMRSGRILQIGAPAQLWAEPADEWVARFVGYRTVVSAQSWSDATGDPVQPGEIALRTSALVVEKAGPIEARCVRVTPGAERTIVAAEVPKWGAMSAISYGPSPAPGDTIRLRIDRGGVARLPATAG